MSATTTAPANTHTHTRLYIDIDIDDSDSSTNWPALIIFLIFIAVCVCCVQPWVSMQIAKRAFVAGNACVSKEANEIMGANWKQFRKWVWPTMLWHYCCPCMLCCGRTRDFPAPGFPSGMEARCCTKIFDGCGQKAVI